MAPLIMSLGRSPPIAQDAERKAMDLAQLHPARCDGAGKGMTKGLSWTATVLGKHMSKNQIIAVVAALVILIAIFVWAVSRRGGQEATSQPPQPAPSQQQTPPQPKQP
jgi:hypothetical protein